MHFKNSVSLLRMDLINYPLLSRFSIFQNQLPATGAPVSGMRPGQIKERFEGYVRDKTQQNWKFWMVNLNFSIYI